MKNIIFKEIWETGQIYVVIKSEPVDIYWLYGPLFWTASNTEQEALNKLNQRLGK